MFTKSVLRTIAVVSLAITPLNYIVAQPIVASVSPTPQTITADVASDIMISFTTAIDPLTVTAQSFRVFGRWSGPAAGTLSFEDSNKRIRFNPTDNFFAGEWVTIALSKDVTDAGSSPLASGYSWNFWTKTTKGTLALTGIGVQTIRAPNEGGITSYGAYAGDLNNDGYSDLTIPNESPNDIRVFLNDSGTFGEFFGVYPLIGTGRASPNEGADFNGDFNLDVAVGALGSANVTVFLGDGTGALPSSAAYTTSFDIRGVCVADFDADGDDDILVTARDSDDLEVLENDGSGVFTSGGAFVANINRATSCAVADMNEDGIMDAFVGGFESKNLSILLGDGNGSFTFSNNIASGGSNWMITTGDVNGDGHADVVSAGGQIPEFTVALGDGAGGFLSTASVPSGNFLVAIDLGDVDGDGDLDLAVSSISNSSWMLYENDGTGTFGIAPLVYDALVKASCVIFHDRDNDGDLDMTTIDEGADVLMFFDNDSTDLSVELTDFDVLSIGDDLTLRWKTAMEVSNYGFYVESTPHDVDAWRSIGFVDGAGSTTTAQSYSFSLYGTDPGRYRFRLRQVDFDGTASYSNELTLVLAAPDLVTLSPAFPNPFNSRAVFNVVVPRMQEVTIRVVNVLGQEVRNLYSGFLSGLDQHSFEIDADGLPSGLYIIRVESEAKVATTTVTLAN